MNERDKLLHRVTQANPVPDDTELPSDVVDSRPPLGLLINEGATPRSVAGSERSEHAERRWRGPLVAAATAVAILIVAAASLVLLRSGQGDVVDQSTDPVPTTIEPTPTTVPSPPTTVVVSPESWDPILATTTAGVAPPAAECPADSNSEVPGPVDQLRPEPRRLGNLAGAFDHRAGAVVYVDVRGETWLFDVCTNTWHQPDPSGAPGPAEEDVFGDLVYDVDSDVTIALRYRRVSVYDANTNTWEHRAIEAEDGLGGRLGAVYDPVSGLVITSTGNGDDWDLFAYDVDTDEWTLLGPVTIDTDGPCCTQIDLLGYSDDLDRLILTTYVGDTAATLLVDPRTGEMVISPTADAPIVDLVWPSHAYGTGDGTVYVYMQDERSVCLFDPESLTWPCLAEPPDMPERYVAFSALVGDQINNRLLFINGVHGDWGRDTTDDVWAVDLDNREWNQVLAPSQQ